MPFYDSNAFANEFGSEAANLEYAILSSMLNGNGFAVNGNDQYGGGGPTGFSNTENGNAIMMHSPGGRNLIDTNGRTEGAVQDPTLGAAGAIASTSRGGYTNSIFDRAALRSPPPTAYGQVLSPPRLQDAASADLFQAVSAGLKASSTPFAPQNGPTLGSPAIAPPEVPAAYPGRTAQSVKPLTSEEAYRTVTKPYPYAQSYHYLVQHLKERLVVRFRSRGSDLTLSNHRFEKNDILRIIRALATFRPSLIALQMPLSEEDEVSLQFGDESRRCSAHTTISKSDFRRTDIPADLGRTEQAYLILWNADCRLETDGRDLSRRYRILFAHGMESRGIARKEVYLRGESPLLHSGQSNHVANVHQHSCSTLDQSSNITNHSPNTLSNRLPRA